MPDIYKALQKAVAVYCWFREKGTAILKGSVLAMDVSAAGEWEWSWRFLTIPLLVQLCLPSKCKIYWAWKS